jgi:cyanophycinase-like exopeptidase
MKRSIVALLMLACSLPVLAAKAPYSYYRIGSPGDVTARTSPGTVLMGGGEDVAAAFEWLCGRSGNGDFLVIRASGTDAYNPWVQGLCPGVNSVATLIIPTTDAANDPAVKAFIDAAEVLWIAGGDQSNYINYWQGTAVQSAVNAAIARGVPVGGTSAGMNVLTQFVYSALASKGVTSSQALADPFNRYMSFARDFLSVPGLQATIGDPHFVTRDRMGRDLAFLCRQYAYGWSTTPSAIAVDEATALLIEPNGAASVVGAGTAYFLRAAAPPAVCQPRTPLTYENVDVYRIGPQVGSFDVVRWSGRGGTGYRVSATAGVVTSTQADGSPY